MAGVEFRLGTSDHLKVEDFLGGHPDGISGIIVDAKNLEVQHNAIDAAHAANLEVHVEPLTERLAAEGFSTRGLDYGYEVINTHHDLADPDSRDRLVDAVVSPQLNVATSFTPPHFFVEDDMGLDLNIDLARRTIRQFGPPIRPILAVHRRFLDGAGTAESAASRYRAAGVEHLDLRISPLGGENEGPIKIRSTLAILTAFRTAGIQVVLGSQAAIGESALALGLVQGFSLGIGYRERYDHKSAISRQKQPREQGGTGPRGPVAGIYLPGPAVTLTRTVGRSLFANREIRTRLACPIGSCGDHIDGPARDPRGHYLHARAHDVAQILARPEPWRPMLQRDRLVKAMDLRAAVNAHLPPETPQIKTRTLGTLLGELDARLEDAA